MITVPSAALTCCAPNIGHRDKCDIKRRCQRKLCINEWNVSIANNDTKLTDNAIRTGQSIKEILMHKYDVTRSKVNSLKRKYPTSKCILFIS